MTEYTDLSNQSTETSRLLAEISQMQTAITDLKNAQEQANTDQNLPLPASIAILSSHKANRDQLAIALERQSQENARKRREVEKLRVQLEEMEQKRVDTESFALQAEKSQNAENMQEEMASKKQVGWWYVSDVCCAENRLKAMTSKQMDFLGLKEFKYDEKAQDVSMVLQVANVGGIPIQIQLRNHQFDSAKVRPSVTFAANFRSRTKVLCDSMIS
jgi:type III secretory pathway component EscV